VGREPRLYKRKGFNRKTHTLFIIASEGEKTEKNYFSFVKDSIDTGTKNIFIEFLETVNGNSSPQSVLRRLNEFKDDYSLIEDDQLWIVIDRDKWHLQDISTIARVCRQGRYGFALSNPCFEIWLLLHFLDVSSETIEEKKALKENKTVNKHRKYLGQKLLEHTGKYSKNQKDYSSYINKIRVAINNAKKLCTNPKERWPNEIGTHVYKLMEALIS
jgi:hypothetical protein